MRSSTQPPYWIPYLPGLVVSVLVLLVAGILGGPIAAAIAAFATLPSLIAGYVLIFVVLLKYSPTTRYRSLALGLGLYVVATIVVLLCLNAFGPSQIM